MPFDSKSTAYELINGGGKSVLLMMILQVVLPNESLKTEKPVKNIFIGTKDITSHVLVEWELEDGGYYSHLLTGFCARKARDKDTKKGHVEGGTEYFNYTFLYNKSNPNDIYSLDLFKINDKKKSVMSYNELNKKLKRLKANGEPIEIYSNMKGIYQETLKGYQIIEAEWDILKRINAQENNLANYFRGDKSSKRLIENFLVGIVDKIAENKDKLSEEDFADVLVKMKERFAKLQREYERLHEYEEYEMSMNKLTDVIGKAIEVFTEVDDFNVKIASIVFALSTFLKKHECLLESKNKEFQIEHSRLESVRKDIKNTDICKKIFLMNEKHEEYRKKSKELDEYKDSLSRLKGEIKYLNSINLFFDYKDSISEIEKLKEELRKTELSDVELKEKRNYLGRQFKYALIKREKELIKRKNELISEDVENEKLIEACEERTSELNRCLGSYKSEERRFLNELQTLNDALQKSNTELLQTGKFNTIIYDANIQIEQLNEELAEVEISISVCEENLKEIEEKLLNIAVEKTEVEGNIKLTEKEQKINKEKIIEYNHAKEIISTIARDYDIHDFNSLKDELTEIYDEEHLRKSELEFTLNDLNKQIEIIREHGVYVFNNQLIDLYEHLKTKFNAVLGSEYLKSLSKEVREEMLIKFRLLPYSILLPQSEYNSINANLNAIGKKFIDVMIPIVNMDAIRGNISLNTDGFTFPTRELDFHLSSLENIEVFMSDLIHKKENSKLKLDELNESIIVYQGYISSLNEYLRDYPVTIVNELLENESFLDNELRSLKNRHKNLKNSEKEEGRRKQEQYDALDDSKRLFESLLSVIKLLETYKQLSNVLSENEGNLKKAQLASDEVTRKLNVQKRKKENLVNRRKTYGIEIIGIDREITKLDDELSVLSELEVPDVFSTEDSLETLKKKFHVYNEKYKIEAGNVDRINGEITTLEGNSKEIVEELEYNGFAVEQIELNELTLRVPKDVIRQKVSLQEKVESVLEDKRAEQQKSNEDYIELKTKTVEATKSYVSLYSEFKPLLVVADLDIVKEKKNELRSMQKICSRVCEDINSEILELTSKIQKHNRTYRDFTVFANTNNIDINEYTKFEFESIEFEVYGQKHKELLKSVKKVQEQFNTEKKRLIKSSDKFTVRNFRDDVEKIERPGDLNEAKSILDSLSYYQQILQSKKEKILIEIEHEKSFKDGFIQQCVGAGVWMYEQLMKLNSLSKIKIPDLEAKKAMVEISLRCYDEDVQKQRMENHINGLVERITEENKKNLSRELSSKAFLAQVADMNTAKVYLYKVEDIVSKSRKIRWEYAVESDGQTHTLYFLFLASVIAFIRKLSTGSEKLTKKVLIVDNPFGSASAVYLWRVMFAMMKENNFQLISAGHDISKEILPYFEVNYLLSEDFMSNGTKKVVVHDFRGIVEREYLSEDELNTEQLSFFED